MDRDTSPVEHSSAVCIQASSQKSKLTQAVMMSFSNHIKVCFSSGQFSLVDIILSCRARSHTHVYATV